jgi:hypothetical protein
VAWCRWFRAQSKLNVEAIPFLEGYENGFRPTRRQFKHTARVGRCLALGGGRLI